jgi:hypothetical protein
MTSRELDNLVATGQLTVSPATDAEVAGLRQSGEARLETRPSTRVFWMWMLG